MLPTPWVRLAEAVLDHIVPADCSACGLALDPGTAPLCPACLTEVRMAPRGLVDGVPSVGPFRYEGPITTVIQAFKYGGQPELARPLARMIATRVGPFLPPGAGATLVPVPIHPRRLAERGYNQSALLAQRLAPWLGRRVSPRALARLTDTRAQVTLSKLERKENLAGRIAARRRLDGSVILVDDVLTTGATATACLHALRSAGADPIAIVTIAVAG